MTRTRILMAFALFLAISLTSGLVRAEVRNVPVPYATVQDAINAGIPNGYWLSIRTWGQGGSSWVYAVDKNIGPSTNIHVGDAPPDAVCG